MPPKKGGKKKKESEPQEPEHDASWERVSHCPWLCVGERFRQPSCPALLSTADPVKGTGTPSCQLLVLSEQSPATCSGSGNRILGAASNFLARCQHMAHLECAQRAHFDSYKADQHPWQRSSQGCIHCRACQAFPT